MARVLKGSHSFTCTPRVHPLTEWTIPAFAFPAEAGTHLPTPDGWKAELALVAGWLHTKINVLHRKLNPDTVAHLRTNRARRRLTSLIEANALTTTPDHQLSDSVMLFNALLVYVSSAITFKSMLHMHTPPHSRFFMSPVSPYAFLSSLPSFVLPTFMPFEAAPQITHGSLGSTHFVDEAEPIMGKLLSVTFPFLHCFTFSSLSSLPFSGCPLPFPYPSLLLLCRSLSCMCFNVPNKMTTGLSRLVCIRSRSRLQEPKRSKIPIPAM